MRTIYKAITTAFFFNISLIVYGFPSPIDTLRFEVVMNQKMLDDIHLDVSFIHSVDIASNQLILLSSTDQFYVLGWGGIIPIGEKITGNLNSYAFTPDNYLLIISNNDICSIDSIGNLTRIIKLPNEGMGISAGKYVMYVYDRIKNEQKKSLYIIVKGGKYARLFEISKPINSVFEINNSILFASENGLFSFNLKSKETKALAALPGNNEIKSIVADTSGNKIYFSTDSRVYALEDSKTVMITDQFGGILRYFNDGLIVFNPEKKFLIRIVGLEGKITSKIQELKNTQPEKSPDNILTNTTIIDLVKSNLSDGLIINLINRSVVDFNLSIDAMIYLSSQNVSSAVIVAMKNAMKRKAGTDSNGTKQ